jgi:hypothetical protein
VKSSIALALIPISKAELYSTVSREETIRRLRGGIRFTPSLFAAMIADGPDGRLAGKWRDGQFTLTRKISCANVYVPWVKGGVQSDGTGTIVNLAFFAPFSAIVFAFAAFFGASVGRRLLCWSRERAVEIGVLGIVSMHVAGVLLFFWEKRKIERRLAEILQSDYVA